MSSTQTGSRHQSLWPVPADASLPAAAELLPAFTRVLEQEKLDTAGPMRPLFESLYLPMAGWLAHQQQARPLLVGIHGGQGSGKSTLGKILKALLEAGFDRRVAVISIDDLYLPRQQRLELASRVHPLLATRGVPGTHDVVFARSLFDTLKRGEPGLIQVPVFDKAMDDRAPESRWQQLQAPVDIILFEGWCVGAQPQPAAQLEQPINMLEAGEDTDGRWRAYVNQQLEGPYSGLFSLLDRLIMLKIPDMNSVFEWRLLQENRLRESLAGQTDAAQHLMSEDALKRFIMHYERITRHCLEEMPDRADLVLALNRQHQVDRVILNGT